MTKIEWTEKTWNVVTGCTKISAGCSRCYAERMAKRLQAMGQPNYVNGFAVTLHDHMLDVPLHRKKPTMYFVCSMSDLFHVNVPFEFIDRVFETMRATPQHTYQVLTKRPHRMKQYAQDIVWPQNVWAGTSIESQKELDRIRPLREIWDAPVRFLSCEPLIGPLLINTTLMRPIDWLIVGAESGPAARPMKLSWARTLKTICQMSETAFFMKQIIDDNGHKVPFENFPSDLQIREFPDVGKKENK